LLIRIGGDCTRVAIGSACGAAVAFVRIRGQRGCGSISIWIVWPSCRDIGQCRSS
jgi:hypothetical protein